jgi:hypothetical protein
MMWFCILCSSLAEGQQGHNKELKDHPVNRLRRRAPVFFQHTQSDLRWWWDVRIRSEECLGLLDALRYRQSKQLFKLTIKLIYELVIVSIVGIGERNGMSLGQQRSVPVWWFVLQEILPESEEVAHTPMWVYTFLFRKVVYGLWRFEWATRRVLTARVRREPREEGESKRVRDNKLFLKGRTQIERSTNLVPPHLAGVRVCIRVYGKKKVARITFTFSSPLSPNISATTSVRASAMSRAAS